MGLRAKPAFGQECAEDIVRPFDASPNSNRACGFYRFGAWKTTAMRLPGPAAPEDPAAVGRNCKPKRTHPRGKLSKMEFTRLCTKTRRIQSHSWKESIYASAFRKSTII